MYASSKSTMRVGESQENLGFDPALLKSKSNFTASMVEPAKDKPEAYDMALEAFDAADDADAGMQHTLATLFTGSKQISDDFKYPAKAQEMSEKEKRKRLGRATNPNIIEEGLNTEDIQLDASPIAAWTHPLRLLSTFSMMVFVCLNITACMLIMVSMIDPSIPAACWRDFAVYEALVLFIWTFPHLARYVQAYDQSASALAIFWGLCCVCVWFLTVFELARN